MAPGCGPLTQARNVTKIFVDNDVDLRQHFCAMVSKRRQPTKAELAILRVLWNAGPLSVRDVQTLLNHAKPTGYTTVLKLLQIMAEKGLVTRDESARTHVYAPAYTEDQTQRQLVMDLVERAFDGSAAKLVLQALASKKATPEELDEIRKLLNTRGGSR